MGLIMKLMSFTLSRTISQILTGYKKMKIMKKKPMDHYLKLILKIGKINFFMF